MTNFRVLRVSSIILGVSIILSACSNSHSPSVPAGASGGTSSSSGAAVVVEGIATPSSVAVVTATNAN
jgi:hypothetical protein